MIGVISELLCVRGRREGTREQRKHKNRHQQADRNQTRSAHSTSLVAAGDSSSEKEFAATVTIAITSVRLTSRGTSRDSAAFQASCPNPGESQTTSTGIAAANAMLTVTPARASIGAARLGRTCQPKTRTPLSPRALAVSTCGIA